MLQDPRIAKDLKNLIYLIWMFLGLPKPTPIQYDIADYLQYGPKKRIVEAFRGVAKSYLTIGFSIWKFYRDPDRKVLVASASKQLADNFSTMALQVIKGMPQLQWLAPGDGQREAKVQFDVGPAKIAKDPSLRSVGITGMMTGSRADDIIFDDIEIPNNSNTGPMRDKLSESVKEAAAILKPTDDASVTVLGTPQCEESLYNKMPERGYRKRIWPARYPDEKLIAAYGDDLAPFISEALKDNKLLVGKPTDPIRFNDLVLTEKELEYGRSGFALQFMLDTTLSDANRYPLKLADLIVMPLDPERAPIKVAWGAGQDSCISDIPCVGFSGDRYYKPIFIDKDFSEYTGAVMAIDPSGRGADETGYAVVKNLHGTLFVTSCGGLTGGYAEENLKRLSQIAKDHKVGRIIIEPNFGDGMFAQLLKPILMKIHPQCSIQDTERSNAQKELRIIDCLEPVMNRHKLVIDRKVIEQDYHSVSHLPGEHAQQYMLMYQLTRITKDRGCLKHDDRLDALALGVHYWTSQMARDQDVEAKESKDRAAEKMINEFLDDILGSKSDSGRFSAIDW